MIKYLFIALLAASPSVYAKKSSDDSLRHRRNLLKNISCKFSGKIHSATGTPLGSVEFPEPDNTVCDPLSNGTSTSPEKGLMGKLIVKGPEMSSQVRSVMDYYNKGLKLDTKIYFADVNVPTRNFTQGFATQNGDVLLDAQGNKLIEHFAIEYDSILRLSENDPEGHYEISVLSDDGARLFIKEDGKWNELVNNDGNHATRLGCAYRTIELKKDSEVPMKLLYYQGARYHIANVLMWKHHKKEKSWKKPASHSLCGMQSNHLFYNPKNGSKQYGIKVLEKTGWKTITAENFKMPPSTSNPCVEPEFAITDFKALSVVSPEAELSWSTNFPATSRLRIINVFTGEEYYTAQDPNLVTEHRAKLGGLIRGLQYQAQAISVDAKGKEVRSELLTLLP